MRIRAYYDDRSKLPFRQKPGHQLSLHSGFNVSTCCMVNSTARYPLDVVPLWINQYTGKKQGQI
jgi:hypothetical protein